MSTRAGMLILRLGLGIFLLLWSIDKFMAPDATIATFQRFYHGGISHNVAYWIGLAEVALSLAILAGAWRTVTYGLGAGLYALSTLSSYHLLLHPFGKSPFAFAALPILAAFIALFLMRDKDTLWTV